MSVLALTAVAIVVLIVLVCIKTKLEHDIERNAIDECNYISKKKTRKKKEKASNKNTTKQQGWFFSKKIAIAFAGVIIEIILVFLGITGALAFNDYQERNDVSSNVWFAKSYLEATYDMIEELSVSYRAGECVAEDIRFNVTVDEAILNAVIDSDEAWRQINPSAISFVFSVHERIHDLIKVMNNDDFDDAFLSDLLDEMLYQLNLLIEGLKEVEIYLAGGDEYEMMNRILRLHQECLEHKSGADLLG